MDQPETYYNPQIFLEPLQAKNLHKTLLISTQKKTSNSEVKIISTSLPPRNAISTHLNSHTCSPIKKQQSTPYALLEGNIFTEQSQFPVSKSSSDKRNNSLLPPTYNSITSPCHSLPLPDSVHESSIDQRNNLPPLPTYSPIISPCHSLPHESSIDQSSHPPPTYSPITSPCHSLPHESSIDQSSHPPPTYSPITSPCHSLPHESSIDQSSPPPSTYSPIISTCHSLSHEFSVNQSSPPPPTYSPITSPCHSLSPSDSVSPTNPPDVITPSQNQFNKNFEIPDLHHIIKHDNLPPLLHEILPKSYTYIFQKIDIKKPHGCIELMMEESD